MTTSVALFLHGSPLASLRVQPFGFLLVLAAPLLALWAVRAHLRGEDLARVALGPCGVRVIAAVAGALVVAWVWTWGSGGVAPGL